MLFDVAIKNDKNEVGCLICFSKLNCKTPAPLGYGIRHWVLHRRALVLTSTRVLPHSAVVGISTYVSCQIHSPRPHYSDCTTAAASYSLILQQPHYLHWFCSQASSSYCKRPPSSFAQEEPQLIPKKVNYKRIFHDWTRPVVKKWCSLAARY